VTLQEAQEGGPFALTVQQHRSFTCCVCGQPYDRTRAVQLASRDRAPADVELTFCAECISAAAVAARTRSLSAVPPAPTLPKLSTCVDRVGFMRQKLLEEGYSARTIVVYVRECMRAEHFCEDAGYTLRNAPESVIAGFVATRKRTEPTRKQLRSALGHYWRLLPRKNPPLWLVRVPKKKRGVCRTAEEDEARAIVIRAKGRDDKQGLAVLLGLYLALRREEIAMLRWDAFSSDGWVTIVGKGDQEAKLPVHPVLLDALARLQREDLTWVFPGRKAGTHTAPATVWTWVGQVGREAGVENLTPHRLRHTALATANDRTGDLRAVQDFARHAKVDTTSMYTRSTARRLVEVMRAIDYGDAPGQPQGTAP
jgi:integrase